MRALRIENGMDADRLVKASLAEINEYARENGGLSNAVLVVHVREFVDSPIENGAEPQRKAQPR